MTKSDLAWM